MSTRQVNIYRKRKIAAHPYSFPRVLISYIELIVARTRWRPPTKNEIISRPCTNVDKVLMIDLEASPYMYGVRHREIVPGILGHISGICLKTKWCKQSLGSPKHACMREQRSCMMLSIYIYIYIWCLLYIYIYIYVVPLTSLHHPTS